MKKLLTIFLVAFFMNLVWENLHSLLYANNMGKSITELVLFKATIMDALMITIISLPFVYFFALKKYDWFIVVVGIILAIAIEKYALETGMWTYNTYMPIIPFLQVGLTPTIQLGILGYLSYKITYKIT